MSDHRPRPTRTPRSTSRSVVSVLGLALTVAFALAGLVFVGVWIFAAVAMSHYGSNK